MAGTQPQSDSALSFEEYFLGSAKVKLANLQLDAPVGRVSLIAQQPKIDKLLHRFEKDGCNRLHRANHIAATISRELLSKTLQTSEYGSIEQLRRTPLHDNSSVLDFPEGAQLLYYDGQARLEALRQYSWHDQWWVIDLYDHKIGQKLAISERARNNESTRNAAGIVFLEYLDMVDRHNYTEAEVIGLGLSTNELKEAKSISKRPALMAAFLALRIIPALCGALKGGLHRSSGDACDDELIHCLHLIVEVWVYIATDQHGFLEINPKTIQLLEGRNPGQSHEDRKHVRKQMHARMLCPGVIDGPARERLEKRILSIKHMIPSLTTYSRDTMHLHQIVRVLKLLLDPRDFQIGSTSVRAALKKAWPGPPTSSVVPLEDKEDGNIVKMSLKSGTWDCFEVSLQGLVLFAMRNYRMMINVAAKTTPGHEKAPIKEPNPRYLHLFAKTAWALGFRSKQIESLLQINYTRQLLEQFLDKVAPQKSCAYDVKPAVDRLLLEFQQIPRKKRELQNLDGAQNGTDLKATHRYGRPHNEDSADGDDLLFLKNIMVEPVAQNGVTSSYARVEFFRRFWEAPHLKETDILIEIEMSETHAEVTPRRVSESECQSQGPTGFQSTEAVALLRKELTVAQAELEKLRNGRVETSSHEKALLYTELIESGSESEYSDDPRMEERRLRAEQAKMHLDESVYDSSHLANSQVDATDESIAQYISELERCTQECVELRKTNLLKDSSIQKLEAQIVEMTAHGSNEQDSHKKSSTRENDLARLNEDLARNQVELESEVAKYITSEAIMRLQIEGLREQVMSLEAERSERTNMDQVHAAQKTDAQKHIIQQQKSNQERDELKDAGRLKDATIESLMERIAVDEENARKLARQKDEDFERLQKKTENEVAQYITSAAMLELELEDLQAQVTHKTDQISSLQQELSDLKQSKWFKQASGSDTDSSTYRRQLVQRIKALKAEIESGDIRLPRIADHYKAVENSITRLSNSTSSRTLQQFSDLKVWEERRQRLKSETSMLKKLMFETMTELIQTEFDLMAFDGGDVLFFEVDSISEEAMSEAPDKVPIRAEDLEAKFRSLLTRGYVAWCFINEQRFQIDLLDSLQWKQYLAHAPVADKAAFYTKLPRKHTLAEAIDGLDDWKRPRLGQHEIAARPDNG